MADFKGVVNFQNPGAIEAEAAAWVARLDAGEATPDDIAAFEAWRERSDRHRDAAARLAKLWDEMDELGCSLGGAEAPFADRRSWLPAARPLARAGYGRRAFIGGAVAAAAGWAAFSLAPARATLQIYDTAVGQQRTVVLDDGSEVQLNTDSLIEVRYSRPARDIRLVKGEAYFEVASDKGRPFSVYAGDKVVRAVGTAFNLRLDDRRLDITLSEGAVKVATLSAGDAPADLRRAAVQLRKPLVTLSAAKGPVETVVVDGEVAANAPVAEPAVNRKLAWRQGMLVFAGDPLSSVVADVSRYTDISITILDPELNDIPVGGYFKVGAVDAMLEALGSFGVQAVWIDARHVQLSRAS